MSELFEDVRRACAPDDAATEVETVGLMKRAIDERDGQGRPQRRSRLQPLGVRAVIAVGAVALVGTASAAVEGSPVSIPGVPAAVPASDVAKSVLASLGIQQRTDEEDAAADQADRERDENERNAEGAGPLQRGGATDLHLPDPAKTGIATAEKNRADALRFVTAMRDWARCVAQKAPQHEASGASGDFDPVLACGAKPTNKGGLGADDPPETEDEDSGRRGPPATAGRPAGAGPPTGAGPPEGAGPPPGVGPRSAPRSSGSGGSGEPGPPPGAGPPAGAGPPDGAGPPAGVPSGGDDEDGEDEAEQAEQEDEAGE